MRIRDLSSDVCSSDLCFGGAVSFEAAFFFGLGLGVFATSGSYTPACRGWGEPGTACCFRVFLVLAGGGRTPYAALRSGSVRRKPPRSEERRVGEEGVSECSARGSPYN